MKASQCELFSLKEILNFFAIAMGLKVNNIKSCLLSITLNIERATHLAAIFGCQIGSFPFTYLGLLMGITRPK
jgi:hypothetical protein